MMDMFELIRTRRSVRSCDSRPLREEDRTLLADMMKTVTTPYGVPATFRLLEAEAYGLTSPVVTGASLYLAGKIEKSPHAEEAFGWAFEELVLAAWERGIGTVWMAATMNRSAFEKAMDLQPGEMMPCVSPVGYPAPKMSLRETVMRKGTGADDRRSFEELFFMGDFSAPLTPGEAGKLARPLEAVRRAPSAVNRQPWRGVVTENAVHLYLRRSGSAVRSSVCDLQKVDMGIALCHLARGLKAEGIPAAFALADPGLPTGERTEYIASFALGSK